MRVTVLGSGSPEADPARASSGYLIEVAGDRILFDCGGGTFGRLLEAGVPPSEISHLFFSHLHSDHMMDYARLVHASWDEGGDPIHVFGPAPINHITERLFGPDGAFAHDLKARCEHPASQAVWQARGRSLPRPWPKPIVTEVTPGFAFDGKSWAINSTEVAHAQPFLACMALSVEAGGRRFAYSGDAALSPDAEAFFAGADLLIHWCYRADGEATLPDHQDLAPTPSGIAAMAARAGAKRLGLTHFRSNADLEKMRAAAEAEFPGAVLCSDLDRFEL